MRDAVPYFLVLAVTSYAFPAVSCGRYEGRLILEDVAHLYERDVPDDIGHTEFKLLAPYTYVDCEGRTHVIPPTRQVNGETVPTVINGASIPSEVWSFVGGPWSGKYRNAAVIHDFLVETRYANSDITHRIFFDAMLTSGTPGWKANIMYFAVLKGGSKWEAGKDFISTPSGRNLTREDLEEAVSLFKSKSFSPEEIEQMVRNKD